jgi:hypothetical protein
LYQTILLLLRNVTAINTVAWLYQNLPMLEYPECERMKINYFHYGWIEFRTTVSMNPPFIYI